MELLSKAVRRKKRHNFLQEFKKQLAQRALEPGVYVSLLAQENDINVNMQFKWRRQLREGCFDGVTCRQAMFPVTVVDESFDRLPVTNSIPTELLVAVSANEFATHTPSVIEVQIAGAAMWSKCCGSPAMACAY
ncbi:transposase [Undibacterium rugosum]|uniref:transposase n=1 Tax=Undibacterium rugosum TaxID=2762291 RepID=UPI001C9B2F36|nr:transposase [Undibacterium rugosum]